MKRYNIQPTVGDEKDNTKMSKWITDRKPTAETAGSDGYVWVTRSKGMIYLMKWDMITNEPWMRFDRPEPYVKPKKYFITIDPDDWRCYYVKDAIFNETWATIRIPVSNRPHEESQLAAIKKAERIAAIYNEEEMS